MRWTGVSARLAPGIAATANNEAKKEKKRKKQPQNPVDCYHWTEELSGAQYTHTHNHT